MAFYEQEAAKAAEVARNVQTEDDALATHPGILTPTKDGPGRLFKHMVLRLAPFAVRGVLWYQGESDDEDLGAQACHREALATIIDDWRLAWNDPNLAFLVVQLPGYGSWQGVDAQDYVTIRAAQQDVADTIDKVWLCSIACHERLVKTAHDFVNKRTFVVS